MLKTLIAGAFLTMSALSFAGTCVILKYPQQRYTTNDKATCNWRGGSYTASLSSAPKAPSAIIAPVLLKK